MRMSEKCCNNNMHNNNSDYLLTCRRTEGGKTDPKMRRSEKCGKHKNKSDNPLTSRRTNGGKTWSQYLYTQYLQ